MFQEILFKKFVYVEQDSDTYDEFIYDTFIQLLKALSFLHEGLSIAHWDIKPSNILFDANHELVLSDFGTSKKIEKTFDETYQKFTSGTSTGF